MDTIHGTYGEYKVLVDGEVVIDGGAKVMLGLVPSTPRIVAVVRDRLGS